MPTKKRTRSRASRRGGGTAPGPGVSALERRVRRLENTLARERALHVRKLELVRRAANRRLAAMMQEIAALRHHEARAEALERMLAAQASGPGAKGMGNGEDSRLPG